MSFAVLKSLVPLALVIVLARCERSNNDPLEQEGDSSNVVVDDDLPIDTTPDDGQTPTDGDPTTDNDPGTDDDGDSLPPADVDPVVYGLDERPANADCHAFTPPPVTDEVHFVERFPNVVFNLPVGMFQRPGDNTRWYVVERGGVIKYFPNEATAVQDDVKTALDLSDVTFASSDCSMGSLAFPPNFATSKVAYIGYCYVGPDTGNQLQLRYSRFHTSDGGATFDRDSEELMVTMDFDYVGDHSTVGLHSNNVARFGADGYYYFTVGDGGPQGYKGGNHSQDPFDMRGKLNRIDVSDLDKKLEPTAFLARQQRVIDGGIPFDNPFADGAFGHPAVYAYGFRNPWQWHFDRETQQIWLGDVGNSSWEEIDRNVIAGGNYGWGYREGFVCAKDWVNGTGGIDKTKCNPNPELIAPLIAYGHGSGEQSGNAVTGGVVYRGANIPSLYGAYVFGDYSSRNVWVIPNVDDIPLEAPCPDTGTSECVPANEQPAKVRIDTGKQVGSFAEDQNGEVFATLLTGQIVALQATAAESEPNVGPPTLLSQTGCFDPEDPTVPASDLIEFAPHAELWSDGATKRRWMVVPDGNTVTVDDIGDFQFPAGSVLIKEFSLDGKRIETRFLVRQTADGRWAGYNYLWDDDETDATLIDIDGYAKAYGEQAWAFPSRTQCFHCHTRVADEALGPEVAQLNHDITYAATGRDANQVKTLEHIGLLDLTGLAEPWVDLASITDTTRSVSDRARSYLHVNCSSCHRPDGATYTPLDLRYDTAFADMGICDVLPTISDLEEYISTDPRLLAPGAPERSVLFVRLTTEDEGIRMPPVARSLTDQTAADIIAAWITQTTACGR